MKQLSGKVKTTAVMIAVDFAIITACYFLAVLLLYFPNKDIPWFFERYMVPIWLIFAATTFFSTTLFGCNRSIWKYTGTADSLKLGLAVVFSVILLLILSFALLFIREAASIEVSFIIVYGLFCILFLLAPRFYFKIFMVFKNVTARARAGNGKNIKRVLLFGAGYTGRAILEQFINNPQDGYLPVAIIDDDKKKIGSSISGVKIVGGREVLLRTVKEYDVDLIVIAVQNVSKRILKEIYQRCVLAGKPVKIVPKISNADQSMKNVTLEIREIQMDELLGREEFETNVGLIEGIIKDKVVLVTGGAGSIGSELCRQALFYSCKHLIILDAHENSVFLLNQELERAYPKRNYSLEIANIRDRAKLKAVFEQYKPEIVFHAAAYKHVPMMEISPVEAVKNNVFGTRNVIEQCNASGVKKFVLISTDKAVNPANVMGATKRIAEMLVQYKSGKTKTELAAVRFGNVLGSNGSVIGIFLEQIKNGGPVTLTHNEIKRYFMTIPEAVRLVLQAGALAKSGEIFVLDMGEPVYIRDLASDLIKMNGLQPGKDVKIEVTGLRAGEKLFEELKFDNEACDKTSHSGIFACKLEDVDKNGFERRLAELQKSIDGEDAPEMLKTIFEIVPSVYRV